MTAQHYDVIVIGSGAGAKISSHAAKLGKRVALLEDGPLGGTCLNRGCIPSKLYIHTADIAQDIREAGKLNLSAELNSVDFPTLVKRVTGYVTDGSAKIQSANEKNPNIDVYRGRGVFVDKKTVTVNDQPLTADTIVIAAGARPFVPPIDGLTDTPYLTSTEALRLAKLPQSLIVIGGGYIGSELGHFFGGLGTKVIVIQGEDRLVPREDRQISQTFTDIFGQRHTVLLNHTAQSVAHDGRQFTVAVSGPDGTQTVSADQLLVATGVRANSDTLGVTRAGITTDERGYIQVNDFLETNVPGIWAFGDIIGRHMFRHAANWEARYAIQNIFTDQKLPVDYTAMPHAVFTNPQIAGVGKTEDELRAAGTPYTIGIAEYKNTAMGEAYQERAGYVKALASADKQTILGCHIIGPQASTLIHEVVVAMKLGAQVSAITDTIHIHPALNEVVQRAFIRLQ